MFSPRALTFSKSQTKGKSFGKQSLDLKLPSETREVVSAPLGSPRRVTPRSPLKTFGNTATRNPRGWGVESPRVFLSPRPGNDSPENGMTPPASETVNLAEQFARATLICADT